MHLARAWLPSPAGRPSACAVGLPLPVSASLQFDRIPSMKVYGLFGITHGAARVLTVMSPAGARAAFCYMTDTDDLIVTAGDGRLTQYFEKRNGALQRLIDAYDIEVLSKEEWDRCKQALADDIWK